MTALDLPDGGLGGLVAHFSTHHTPPEHLRPAEAYGGHPVSYDAYMLPAEHITGLIDGPNPKVAGWSFAYFLARKPKN